MNVLEIFSIYYATHLFCRLLISIVLGGLPFFRRWLFALWVVILTNFAYLFLSLVLLG